MSQEQSPWCGWCAIELFGHQQIVGFVREQTIAGIGFLRVDVPAVGDMPAFTRMYGPTAIFSLTPITEETALKWAEWLHVKPIATFALPEPRESEDAEFIPEEDRGVPGVC